MTTRDSHQSFIEDATIVMASADYQLSRSLYIDEYHMLDFTQAQQDLEGCLMELETYYHCGSPQQKEELTRLRSQLIALQQKMIVAPH